MEKVFPAQSTARILIIDDDASQRRTLRAILEAEGFDVVTYSSGEAAMERMAQGDIDVGVIDLRLPDVAESQILEHLAVLSKDVSSIIYTGHSSFNSAKKAVNVGAFAYIEKTGDPAELIAQVHRAVEMRLIQRTEALQKTATERSLELQEANEALKQSEARYRELFNSMPSGVAVYQAVGDGEDFVFKDFNRAGETIENVKRENIIGKPVTEVFPDIKKFGIFEIFQRVWKTGQAEHFPEALYPGENDSKSWRDNWVYKLPSGEIVAVYDDITARMLAQEELENNLSFISALFETVPIPLFYKDTNGCYIGCNRAFADLIGVGKEQFLGQNNYDIAPEKLADEYHRRDLVLLQQGPGATMCYETAIDMPDRSTRHYVVTKATYLNRQGDVTGIIGAIQDITDLRKAQEELRNREAELAHIARVASMGEMVATIAHEVNQPLHAISSYSEGACIRIKSGNANPEALIGVMDNILEEAQRASETIRRLRRLLQKHRPLVSSIFINDVIQDALALLGKEFRRRGIDLRLELGNDLPPVTADPVQIEQVILNLIQNAFDAMDNQSKDDRHISITTRRRNARQVEISVEDSGPGFDANVHDKLFDPFWTSKQHGLGMGLAICRFLVDAHNGKIWAESGHGKGAIFRFTLPISEP